MFEFLKFHLICCVYSTHFIDAYITLMSYRKFALNSQQIPTFNIPRICLWRMKSCYKKVVEHMLPWFPSSLISFKSILHIYAQYRIWYGTPVIKPTSSEPIVCGAHSSMVCTVETIEYSVAVEINNNESECWTDVECVDVDADTVWIYKCNSWYWR